MGERDTLNGQLCEFTDEFTIVDMVEREEIKNKIVQFLCSLGATDVVIEHELAWDDVGVSVYSYAVAYSYLGRVCLWLI